MSNAELHHLLNRAVDGVVLHGESDRLRELVRGLEQRAEQAEADRKRVQQAACRTAESLRKAEQRAEQAEDERAKDAIVLHALARQRDEAEAAAERVRAVLAPYDWAHAQVRAATVRAALAPQQPTT